LISERRIGISAGLPGQFHDRAGGLRDQGTCGGGRVLAGAARGEACASDGESQVEHLFGGTILTLEQTLVRLGLATVCGLILGLDRELRGIAAGLRTHALVSVSSAVITISALDLYESVRAHDGSSDPLRVIQGLAQAIGFIAAGAIFVRGGTVKNLTTAANVWLATAVGISAGAGQFDLAAVATGFGVVIVTVVRLLEWRLPKRADRSPDE
jgi:putative Mg2+ transporter-C (MgtC) family protein